MQRVRAVLGDVASTHGVRILYAAESGSRAWGFASPDSDYDVRFIYAHPRNWYLRLVDGRDVIERPLDEHAIDLAGWDVRKALRLAMKSNPVFYEWLVSPVVYAADDAFPAECRRLFEAHAEPRALASHYWSIARGQWHREIDGQDSVRLKKYFYVVRPLLALQWVLAHCTPPPMHFDELRAAIGMPASVENEVLRLLALKRDTPELGAGPRITAIDDWARRLIDEQRPDAVVLPARLRARELVGFDTLFQSTIGARE